MSVLAALFGVQSQRAHRRDFQYGDPIVFILAGIIALGLFIWVLVIVVKFVMSFV